jgi:hypothetical protein
MRHGLELLVAAVLGALVLFVVLPDAGNDAPVASQRSKPAAQPATRSTVAELRAGIQAVKQERRDARELSDRLGECEIAISISRAQERSELECEAEVQANFGAGDRSPPALRAGRFR